MSELVELFARHYGRRPEVLSQAPGRLEILGNHTDYNQGFVLSCAVAQTTEMALARCEGRECRIVDFREPQREPGGRSFRLDEIETARPRDWTNYVKGVIVELRRRGIEIGAFEAAIRSTVPLSAGMSSSAALEMATGCALAAAFGVQLDRAEWARIGQGVENHYLGLKSGLLDQFSSLFGQKDALILSDFRSVEVVRTVAVPPGYCFIVANSMVKHNLVDSEYNVRRQDCENAAAKLAAIYPGVKTLRDVSVAQLEAAKAQLSEREFRRAAHVVGEGDRVARAVTALDAHDAAAFGQLLFESHESSRVNFENSTPELDYLVELAHSIPGCLGARLSGGGFGGITIHLVEQECAAEYGARLQAAYRLRTGIQPEVIACSIGDGATARKL